MAYEALEDQSARLARQLAEADGIVDLVPFEQMPHPTFSAIMTIDLMPNTPRARAALEVLIKTDAVKEIGKEATQASSISSAFDRVDDDYASI